MSTRLLICDRSHQKSADKVFLKKLCRFILAGLLHQTDFQLCLQLVNPDEMTRINEKFLSHRGVTDVITFDYRTTEAGLFGEIFICVDEAQRQASRFRTSTDSEVTRYLIHGILHLLGFSDRAPEARVKMRREENRLLRLVARRFSGQSLFRTKRNARIARAKKLECSDKNLTGINGKARGCPGVL